MNHGRRERSWGRERVKTRWKGAGDESKLTATWLDTKIAIALLQRKHVLPILIYLYETGAASISNIIRRTKGSPDTITKLLRQLESMGVVYRVWRSHSYHTLETRLALKGIQLVETPVYRWVQLIRKWDKIP